MQLCRNVYEQAKQAQENAAKIIMEAQKMKEAVAKQKGEDLSSEFEMAMIPFAAYEMQQDRHMEEKDKMNQSFQRERDSFNKEKENMRKHYKHIIAWVCGAFITFILMVFVGVGYFFANYELSSYSQDGDGINNYLGENAQQGDLNYGAEDTNNAPQD